MSKVITLERVIARLSAFWHDQGCALLPPASFEVPLGLLHPEAFFRLLDGGDWRAAFVQPIHRPADGRGGSHPHRASHHLQVQVVWKSPTPAWPRHAMIHSLRHAGLVTEDHDVRFVDRRLTIDAVEVHGRGWQVVIDGLHVARLTFLDEVGGQRLSSPCVELAYGVERLGMVLAGAQDIFSVPWHEPPEAAPATEGATATEGSVASANGARRAKRRELEVERFRYASELANVAYLRQSLDGLDREAERCVEGGLPRLAYEHAVRMLPELDRLETRGALEPRERQHWLTQVRERVMAASSAYRATYPLAEEPAPRNEEPAESDSAESDSHDEQAVSEAGGSGDAERDHDAQEDERA